MNYIIRDTKEYIKWLDDNLWLNDVIVEDIQFTPNNLTQSKTPQKIKLKCYLQVSGSYQAGEFRTIRKYDISFNDIKEYSLDGKFIKDNCCEGVEDFDSEKGIVFNLFVPGNLLIICNNIEIINQRDEQEIVSSWLSESDFTAEIEGTKLPTPKMWIDYLKKKNLDVVWRIYAGEAKNVNELPGNDFTGWFLQLRNRIENNPYGLFFFSCKTKQSGFYLHIENKDTEVKDIFIAVGELITELDYSKIKIECGNSILETNEWLKHLNNIKKVK